MYRFFMISDKIDVEKEERLKNTVPSLANGEFTLV